MREVIEAIDGPLYLNLCLISERACKRAKWCPAHPVWVKAQEAMLEVLEGAVIAELALAVRPRSGGAVSGVGQLRVLRA
jgi:DNA-binding IscR family transcriptional regulator